MKGKIIAALAILALLKLPGSAEGRLVQRYTDDGRLIQEDYKTEEGWITAGPAGFATHLLVYDEAGNAIQEYWYDDMMRPAENADGVMALTRDYDAQGQITAVRYLDGDGLPMLNRTVGAFAEAYVYDADGLMTQNRLLDAMGNPMTGAKGWSTALYEYAGKRRILERYLDEYGMGVVTSNGCAAISRDFDAKGRTVIERYFDENGRAFLNPRRGCAALMREYDAKGRAIRESYYDADGRPALVKGCHTILKDYDPAGNVSRERYLDAEGHLVTGSRGYAAVERRYDDRKRVVEEHCYDVTGALTLCKDGYAEMTCFYADGDLPVLKCWFDASGSALRQITYDYDADGNAVLERYYDAEGKPLCLESGCCAVGRTYDGRRKLLSIRYLDAQGALTPYGNRNYAMIVYDYDAAGNKLRESYYDRDENPVIAWKGSRATTLWTYDGEGRVTSERYYDADGIPVFTSANYAGYTVEYAGNTQILTYIRPDGTPVKPTSSLPYVKLKRIYDAAGRLVQEEYLDAEGRSTRNQAGVYGRAHEYDDQGREVRSYTFDLNGNVSGGRSKVAVIEYAYDAIGVRTATRYTKSGQVVP